MSRIFLFTKYDGARTKANEGNNSKQRKKIDGKKRRESVACPGREKQETKSEENRTKHKAGGLSGAVNELLHHKKQDSRIVLGDGIHRT